MFILTSNFTSPIYNIYFRLKVRVICQMLNNFERSTFLFWRTNMMMKWKPNWKGTKSLCCATKQQIGGAKLFSLSFSRNYLPRTIPHQIFLLHLWKYSRILMRTNALRLYCRLSFFLFSFSAICYLLSLQYYAYHPPFFIYFTDYSTLWSGPPGCGSYWFRQRSLHEFMHSAPKNTSR